MPNRITRDHPETPVDNYVAPYVPAEATPLDLPAIMPLKLIDQAESTETSQDLLSNRRIRQKYIAKVEETVQQVVQYKIEDHTDAKDSVDAVSEAERTLPHVAQAVAETQNAVDVSVQKQDEEIVVAAKGKDGTVVNGPATVVPAVVTPTSTMMIERDLDTRIKNAKNFSFHDLGLLFAICSHNFEQMSDKASEAMRVMRDAMHIKNVYALTHRGLERFAGGLSILVVWGSAFCDTKAVLELFQLQGNGIALHMQQRPDQLWKQYALASKSVFDGLSTLKQLRQSMTEAESQDYQHRTQVANQAHSEKEQDRRSYENKKQEMARQVESMEREEREAKKHVLS
jgi:hypothetical protein